MPIALAALALAVVAFVLWLSGLSKTRSLSARVASLLVENGALQEQLKSVTADQKKSVKLLEQRNDELIEMRKEIGAIKKKNFALQEEAKKNKSSFEAKLEEREKQLVARPAFEDAEKPKPMKAEASKSREPKPESRGPAIESREPVAESREPNADVRPAGADSELTRRVEALGKENGELGARIGKLESDLRDALGEQRRMKKKVDDYRRADIVNKSRVELLNDKLGSMGRQYYDAVSELAALKGESAPPAPRPPAEKTPEAESSASDDDPAEEDDVRALSQELVGVLQQRDRAN
jgi:chromosome segregation ATPase